MKYLIDPVLEKALQDTILPDVEKRGRIGFDVFHLQAVAYWMKQLVEETQLNSQVMITTAYAHDWGYAGLFEGVNSSDFAEIKKRKPLHMERGAVLIQDLLTTRLSMYFTKKQIDRIAYLVRVHDKVEELKDEDEKLIMEADTLGMLDVDRVKPTFSKEDNEHFLKKEILERRLPRFVHPMAMKIGKTLVEKRREYYCNT